jgi:LPXTG-site transpeptidase (sortase) family protein
MPRKTNKKQKPGKHQPFAHRGGGLILLGLILWLIFGFWRLFQLNILSFSGKIDAQTPAGTAAVAIDIPRVNLHLPVIEATVTDGSWEISPDGASHWDNSANPGGGGNIVIYAHNKTNLFGPIRWLNRGDEIVLTDAEGQQHRYHITETVTVSPKQIDYILPKTEEVLTLYTCTGLFDKDRYLVIAQPAAD